MKKLILYLSLVSTIVLCLITAAFMYVDYSGHENFGYNMFVRDKLSGSVSVDKYVTEEKIVYKGVATFKGLNDLPRKTTKLSLLKKTRMPVEYDSVSTGLKVPRSIFFFLRKVSFPTMFTLILRYFSKQTIMITERKR